MNIYKTIKFSRMMTENYREVDVLKDYWTIRGEVRETSYKLNSVLKIFDSLIIADYGEKVVEKKAGEKEKHREKLVALKNQFDGLDNKTTNLEINIEDEKELLRICTSFADELVDWFKLRERMEIEILESFKFIIKSLQTTQKILTKKCENIFPPTINLVNYYSENRLDTTKDVDKFDNIEIVLNSCKEIKNTKFKEIWSNNDISDNVLNLLKIKNLKENIRIAERDYLAISQNILHLFDHLNSEKFMNQNKRLNFSMLLLALIGGIGVLSNAINIGDNVSVILIILVLLIAFAKWLVI